MANENRIAGGKSIQRKKDGETRKQSPKSFCAAERRQQKQSPGVLPPSRFVLARGLM
jgi:hypothetical protein